MKISVTMGADWLNQRGHLLLFPPNSLLMPHEGCCGCLICHGGVQRVLSNLVERNNPARLRACFSLFMWLGRTERKLALCSRGESKRKKLFRQPCLFSLTRNGVFGLKRKKYLFKHSIIYFSCELVTYYARYFLLVQSTDFASNTDQ